MPEHVGPGYAPAMLCPVGELQSPVDRYLKALTMPQRLIGLHSGRVGHSGNASAIAPAVVLMSISAFEGFVEDATATAMHLQGLSYSYIANVVGRWTNPDVEDWGKELKKHFSVDLSQDFEIRTTRGIPSAGWSAAKVQYDAAMKLASSWMNVRHVLTHGGASARGAERWPTATRKGEPVSVALRPDKNDPGKHHLDLPGARGCAALYTYAARHGSDLLAAKVGEPALKWDGCPDFDPKR